MKKSKSVLFLLMFSVLIISFFLLNYFSVYYEPNSAETTLVKYFGLSKANIETSEMYFWCKTKAIFEKGKDSEQIAKEFASDLEITLKGNPVTNKENNGDFIQSYELEGVLENKNIDTDKPVNVRIKVSETNEVESEKSISVDVSQNKSYAELNGIKKLILKEYKKFDLIPEVNSCITGSFNAKMSTKEMNELSKRLFSEANAQKVEGMIDKNLISVAAYSPNINNSINVSGKKVNLSLAMRYKSFENKTYIWLATPVITTEY